MDHTLVTLTNPEPLTHDVLQSLLGGNKKRISIGIENLKRPKSLDVLKEVFSWIVYDFQLSELKKKATDLSADRQVNS